MKLQEAFDHVTQHVDHIVGVLNKHTANIDALTNKFEQQQAALDLTNNRNELLLHTVSAHAGKLADLQNDINITDNTAQNTERELCNALDRNESLACALDVNSFTISELAARVKELEAPAAKPEAPITAALREENRDLITRLSALQKALHDAIPELRWYVMRKVDLAKPPSYCDTPWSDHLASDIKFLQDALDESLKDVATYDPVSFANAGKPWTAAEDQRLLNEHLILGRTVANIAKMHQRTYAGIESRLERLNQDKRRNA